MNPKISVIIPVYNVESYLRDCLDSVFAQNFESFEVVCVDDGSTDSSPEILAEYARARENLRAIRKENGGLSSARNAGLEAARGEYVWFVDSDDMILGEDALASICRRMDETRADILTFSGRAHIDSLALEPLRSKMDLYLERSGDYPDGLTGPEFFVLLAQAKDYAPSACLQAFRRGFLNAHGLRFEDGLLFEDQLFTLQCFSLAERTAHSRGRYYLYRIREGSIMNSAQAERHARNYFRNAELQAGFYRTLHGQFPDGFRRRYFARVRLMLREGDAALRKLPDAQQRALWRSLTPGVRRMVCWERARQFARRLRRGLRSSRPQIRQRS